MTGINGMTNVNTSTAKSAFEDYATAPRRSLMWSKEEERRAQLLIGKRGPAPKRVGPSITLRGSSPPPDDRSAHGLPSHLVRAPVRTPVAYSRAVPGTPATVALKDHAP